MSRLSFCSYNFWDFITYEFGHSFGLGMYKKIFHSFNWFYFEIGDFVILFTEFGTDAIISLGYENPIPTKSIIKSRFFTN